jgi:hypothetical protein
MIAFGPSFHEEQPAADQLRGITASWRFQARVGARDIV